MYIEYYTSVAWVLVLSEEFSPLLLYYFMFRVVTSCRFEIYDISLITLLLGP